MKKLFIVTSVVTCVILAVGCATVKESENDEMMINYENFTAINSSENTIDSFQGNIEAEFDHKIGKAMNETRSYVNDYCKKIVSVSPNPTSSSATININLDYYAELTYKLIFDEKIIYEDDISEYKKQIVIPEHLIQKDGVYIVAYDIDFAGGKRLYCQNVVQFMVAKKQR